MADTSNNFNQNNSLKKIRSKYILIKIFDNLKENRLLKLVNYNKKYQKLMKIKLKDYKNEFSKIEIEIIPKENTYGKFINTRANIHIYFDDNKEEIKRKKIIMGENVAKIKIIVENKIKSLSGFFSNCTCIKKIKFIKFNINDISDMSYMFKDCSSIEEINLSHFNTNNVTNMRCIFSDCPLLKELNLSNFNTNNVTNMSRMFYGCSSLKELDLSNFITSNANDISWMFFKCSSLKELNLSNFNTSNVTNMRCLFNDCSLLKELNISKFKTNNVTDMSYMFSKVQMN